MIALTALSVLLPVGIRTQLAAQTIAGIYTTGPGTYTVTGTVTSLLDTYNSTNSFTLTDSTGSIIVYHAATSVYASPTVGDNITITDADTTYQGSPEFGNPTAFTLNSSGAAVTPTVLTLAQFNAAGTGSTTKTATPPYAEAYVTLNNVTLPAGTTTLAAKTSYALTDATGTSTLYTYTTYADIAAAVTAANANSSILSGPLDITGYVDVFNGVPELYPLSFTAVAPEPSTYMLMGLGGLALMLVARRAHSRSLV